LRTRACHGVEGEQVEYLVSVAKMIDGNSADFDLLL
jgi:hypothetical protein